MALCLLPGAALAQQEIPILDVSGDAPIALDPIVVTAAGFEQNVTEAPASIPVVPGETDPGRAVHRPHRRAGGRAGRPHRRLGHEDDIPIRGLPGTYALTLVDGRRQSTRESRSNGSAGFEQSFVPPPAAIDWIEIVRGPMSSLYGSDAIGEVINIITKPVADEWTGEVSASTDLPEDEGFGDEQQLSFYTSGPLVDDVLGVQLWGRRFDRDGPTFPGTENEADEYDLTARLSWNAAPGHSFYAEAGITNIEPERLRFREYTLDHYAVGYDGSFGVWMPMWTFSASSASARPSSARQRDSTLSKTCAPRRSATPCSMSMRRANWISPAPTTSPSGAQYFNSKLTDQNPGTGEADRAFEVDQYAVFVEDEWRMTPTFALTGGLRLNKHEEYDDDVTPRLYGVWNATPALTTVKGGVSTGFKAPDIREIALGYLYTTGGRGCVRDPEAEQPCGVVIGDPELEAEQSTSYELSALYAVGDLSLGAPYFHTELEDMIASERVYNPDGSYAVYAADPSYTLFYHYNIGEAQIDGSSSLRTGLPLERTPENAAYLHLEYETAVQGLNVWSAAQYHGSKINAGLWIGDAGDPITNDEGESWRGSTTPTPRSTWARATTSTSVSRSTAPSTTSSTRRSGRASSAPCARAAASGLALPRDSE